MIRPLTNKNITLFLVLCLLALTACTDDAAEQGATVSSDRLYFDYTIWAEEGREEVTCRFQYLLDHSSGDAIRIDSPGRVALDGQAIPPDSTRFYGVFYEIQKPVRDFAGKHQIQFTGPDGKTQNESFEFRSFGLAEELPEQIRRAPFTIRLTGLPPRETPVRLVLIDTSLATEDVNEVIGVVNGEVVITPFYLDKIANGPVNLELSLEEERPIRTEGKRRGRFSYTYVLKRGFDLVE